MYLLVFARSLEEFLIRHDPSWAFFECEGCRATGYSIYTWAVLMAGSIALFVRRREAP